MAMNMGSFASRVVATKVVALDGTGDFDNIQDAINDLPATGGCVYIKEGTYIITAAITINKHNVGLFGCGKSTIIQSLSAINMINTNSYDNITIKDMQLHDNSGAKIVLTGIYINDSSKNVIQNLFLNYMQIGVRASGLSCESNTLTNCIIDHCTNGIKIERSWISRVVNCSVQFCSNIGIWVIDYLVWIDSCNSSFNTKQGILLQNADYSLVSDCNVYSNDTNGIEVDGASSYVKILNNRVDYSTRIGIELTGGPDYAIVKGNSIYHNGSEGIRIFNSVHSIISNNILRDNSQNAIGGYSEILIDGTCTNNIISNNNIYGPNSKYCIEEDIVTCDYNNFLGNNSNGGVTGTYLFGAPNDEIGHNIG